MHTVTIDSEGRITLPARVRKSLGVQPGDTVALEFADGHVRLVRTRHPIAILAEHARAERRAGGGISLRALAERDGVDLDDE